MDLGAGVEMRIVEDLARVQHGAARHARLAQHGHDLVLGARARPGPDDLVERVAVLPARLGVLAAGVGQQVFAADGHGEVPPHAGIDRLHVDVGVVVGPAGRAGVGASWHAPDQLVAPARAGLGVAIVVDVAASEKVGHDLLHGHLDELALSGALALDVGGQDGRGRVDAGPGVADGGAAADRLAVGEAGHAHHAARGLGDHVEALVLVVRPGEPEALDAGHDDPR